LLNDLISVLRNVDAQQIVEIKALLHSVPQIFFVGNGGSAAIASHMAIDWSKNGGVRSQALNDPAALTCLSNDLGYDQVFAWQLERLATFASAVVCISSSGKSLNICNAAVAAKNKGCSVVTLSGFEKDNPLRYLGHANIYVPSSDYGVVECAHLAILHSMVKP